MLKICHDSHLPVYRQPFGAAEAGSEVTLSLSVEGPEPIKGVILRLWLDESGEQLVPMELVNSEGSVAYYRAAAKMPEEGTLLWYYFIIEKQVGGRLFYGNDPQQLGGEGRVYDDVPPAYQITVYDRGAATPDWFKRSIMYQIFPDRFCRAGNELIEKKGAVYRGSWQDDPRYIFDPVTKEVASYDFFGGNLAGVESKLDYLKELGVSVIYFNPIFESESNHRYDTADYLRVDNILGGNEAFDRLLAAANERGISVILDGVFSHTGVNSRYFNRDGRYDTVGAWQSEKSPYHQWYRFENFAADRDKYECWWGFKNLPNVDECNESYQDFIINGADSVLHHWLRAGIKGWRLDVIDELPPEFSRRFYKELKKTDKEAVLIGEVWEDASNKVSYGLQRAYFSGHELDGAMNYPLRKMIIEFLMWGQDNDSIYRRVMNMLENYPAENLAAMMNLLSSHDVERVVTILSGAPSAQGMDANQQREFRLSKEQRELGMTRSRMAALWQFTFPGVPCIYYGDEIAMEGHRDPVNRRPYEWQLTDEKRLAQREWYKKLAALRNQNAALRTGKILPLRTGNEGFAFLRYVVNGQDMFGADGENAVFLTALNPSQESKVEFSLQVSNLAANDFEVVFTTELAADSEDKEKSLADIGAGADGKKSPSKDAVGAAGEKSPSETVAAADGDKSLSATKIGAEKERPLSEIELTLEYGRLHFVLPPLSGVLLREKQPPRQFEREAGILLHPTSLPGKYPIGDLGKEARAFVDFLAAAGQSLWQILPLTEVDDAFSPYRSPSAFAGNTLLISPDLLVEDGLVSGREMKKITGEMLAGKKPSPRVDYQLAAAFKDRLLHAAYDNFRRKKHKFKALFAQEQPGADYWLPDYALYTALKNHFGCSWTEWPEDIRQRRPAAVSEYKKLLATEIDFVIFAQRVFDSQWKRLREYANRKGVEILGDLPLFVAPDSADVWAHPEYFDLNEDGSPKTVAGCPPDYFSEKGQLWGNPQYDWQSLTADGYDWWVQRLRRLFGLVDRVRIDHFRGLESFWEIPGEAETAMEGRWVKGPGEKLFAAVYEKLGPVKIIAEDLGTLTPEVVRLRKKLGLPGMRILQFELGETDQHGAGMILPEDAIAYTGTHDNDTVMGWLKGLSLGKKADPRALSLVLKSLGFSPADTLENIGPEKLAAAAIRYVYRTAARLAVVPLQDALALDDDARMNVPGTAKGNWSWRLSDMNLLDEKRALGLKKMAVAFDRA